MELDEMVARAAESQHGMFTRAQVQQCGGSDSALQHRLRTGTWRASSYRSVYGIAGVPWSWEQELHALVLATGPAAASHGSAAALLGIPGFSRRRVVEVVATRPIRDRTPGARVHSSRLLPPEHLIVVEGIATTCVARTLVDLAGVLHPQRAERVLDNCLARRLITVDAVRCTVDLLSRRGRPGITVMRRLLDTRDENYVPPESSLEARAVDLIQSVGLPDPVRQLDIGGNDGWIGRVDLAYPDRRLVIEVDSDMHHTTLSDRRADQARDRRLRAAGWTVARITEEDLDRPEMLVQRVRTLLEETAA